MIIVYNLKEDVASEGPPSPSRPHSALTSLSTSDHACPAASAPDDSSSSPFSYIDAPWSLGCLMGLQPYDGFGESCKFKVRPVLKKKKKKRKENSSSFWASLTVVGLCGRTGLWWNRLPSPVTCSPASVIQFLLFCFLLSLMKEFFSLIKISKNISDLVFMWQIQNIWGMTV